MIGATLMMALRAIRRNTLRSVLTILGVIIGVGAVIAMVTLGESATARVTQDISGLGTNMLVITPGSDRRGGLVGLARSFDDDDCEAIARDVFGATAVAPSAVRDVLTVYANNNWRTIAVGSDNQYFFVRNWPVARGRDFEPGELLGGKTACVLGSSVAEKLFGGQDPLGERIRIQNVPFEVVGVLASKGNTTFGDDQDDLLVVPLRALQRRITGNRDINVVLVSAASERTTVDVQRQIIQLLRERRKLGPDEEADFVVRDMKEIADVITTVTGILTALLGTIAAVSLLVGGIGIMNIMLVSVTERTREIGIRLAIGARGRDILLQFLLEACLISTFGGVIGIALGLAGSWAGAYFLKLPFVLVPGIIVIAFFFSAAVGIFFGYYPALKAARLDPIEALRHE